MPQAPDGRRILLGLPNIGPVIAARLEAAGIRTVADLRGIGPAAAFRRLAASSPGTTVPVCYYLYSLQGALDGIRWDALPAKTKQRLLRQAGVEPRPRRRAARHVPARNAAPKERSTR